MNLILDASDIPAAADPAAGVRAALGASVLNQMGAGAEEAVLIAARLLGKQIVTSKAGPTAIGCAVEEALDVATNSRRTADMEFHEIKSQRAAKSSLITLMTAENGAMRNGLYLPSWRLKQDDAIERYASPADENGRRNLYHTMKLDGNPTHAGLRLHEAADGGVELIDGEGRHVAVWHGDFLRSVARGKLSRVAYVLAHPLPSEHSGEAFAVASVDLLWGLDENALVHGLARGDVFLDLRLCRKEGKVRNHGTGFRATAAGFRNLYTNRVRLEVPLSHLPLGEPPRKPDAPASLFDDFEMHGA